MTKIRQWANRIGASGGAGDDGTSTPGDAHFFGRLAPLLPRRDDLVLAVLTDDDVASPVDALLDDVPAARTVVISPEGLPEWDLERPGVEHRAGWAVSHVHDILAGLGPVDVIVDLTARAGEQYDAFWRRLVFHLRPHGVYAVDRRRALDDVVPPTMLEVAATVGLSVAGLAEHEYSQRPLRLAVGAVAVDGHLAMVVKRGRHVLKTRDRDATRLLTTREPGLDLEVLSTLPPGSLEVAARIHSHESSVPITALDTVLNYPSVSLRHYRGQIGMVSNALLHTGASALPDSFRHHLSGSPTNPRLVNVSGEFARLRPADRPKRTLEGTYYHLDSENSGHYGHLLTEVVGRMWGWDEAKRRLPDLKAIFRIRFPNERDPLLERRIFGAYGIDPADVAWVDEPVWLESVVAATPMWHNQVPHYVRPELADVWSRIRESLLAEGTAPTDGFERSGGRKLFVSRHVVGTNRACRNIREVETFFADRGFDVLYPEEHDLADQAAIFDRADHIAGFGGSAMFNIMFSRGYETLILLNHEAYTARNEHLYTALLGGDVHYFWSTPDVEHPENGWSEEAYYSSWEFDFDRNAGPLDEVLAGLSSS